MSNNKRSQQQKAEIGITSKAFADALKMALNEECVPAESYKAGPVDDLRAFVDVGDYAYNTKFRVVVEFKPDISEYKVQVAEKDAEGLFFDPDDAAAFILGLRRYVDSGWDDNDEVDLQKKPNPGVALDNGGVVVQTHQVDNHLDLVLCTLPHNDHTPWVTWQYNRQTGGAAHGDYCTDFQEALESFADRVGKLDDLYG